MCHTPSIAFRHLPYEGCRKPVLGVCVCDIKDGVGGGGGTQYPASNLYYPKNLASGDLIFCRSLERVEESCPTMKSAYRGDKLTACVLREFVPLSQTPCGERTCSAGLVLERTLFCSQTL